ncbi:MAG: hypothetical protein AAFN30_13995 [Actinomycetota bacterium]
MALAIVVAGGFLAATAVVRHQQRAQLVAEQELPADVRAEVDQTWERFNDVFGSQRRCVDDVRLRLVSDVPDGDARYVVDERRIDIEIPTSPRRFRESFVHELAHHVEHTCARADELRRSFLALDGVSGPWHEGSTWATTPSELWAETVVLVVNGERVRHGRSVPLPAGAETVVREWAASG